MSFWVFWLATGNQFRWNEVKPDEMRWDEMRWGDRFCDLNGPPRTVRITHLTLHLNWSPVIWYEWHWVRFVAIPFAVAVTNETQQRDVLRSDWLQPRRTGSFHSALTATHFGWHEMGYYEVWGYFRCKIWRHILARQRRFPISLSFRDLTRNRQATNDRQTDDRRGDQNRRLSHCSVRA